MYDDDGDDASRLFNRNSSSTRQHVTSIISFTIVMMLRMLLIMYY